MEQKPAKSLKEGNLNKKSATECEDAAEPKLQTAGKDTATTAVDTTNGSMRTRQFEHPLYKGENFELRAGENELGLVLTVQHGKKISVRFSIDKWATFQEIEGHHLEPGKEGGKDRVYFRVPVGRDAIRVASGANGGVDFSVRYHDDEKAE